MFQETDKPVDLEKLFTGIQIEEPKKKVTKASEVTVVF